jgi:exodeoxyribonuclease VII small subunit
MPDTKPEAGDSPGKAIEAEIEELQKIVAQLEENKDKLEESLALYERGVALSQNIKKRITEVETKVEILSKRSRQSE